MKTVARCSSNGVVLELDESNSAPMADSTDLLADPDRLRERYRQDGYLLLRGVLDPAEVWAVREAYFSLFPPGYLKPGTGPAAGVYSGRPPVGLAPYGTAGHPAHDFVRSDAYAAFTRSPELAGLARSVLGGPVQLVPRRILRHYDSASRSAARAHVDRAYPSGAGGELVTAWIPLGDCPLETGGVVYLEGSHRLDPGRLDGDRPVTDRPDDARPFSHDLAWTARTLGGRWLWTDFRAGDVVLHSPDTVHATLDTTTETMRLSTDLRFVSALASVRSAWQQPWSADDGE
ncbi:phytanoyl-CoA dioxygenase family protein [Kitasatospora viridis]|uniref:Ectoine hydroxylase-related dioxygenase (Phytanoyl-CoA dioxygenase family) n=1 Tax=Kitasatospora viridis TaxID=281105 RepID=A0A561UHW6_9ACTN|nr:phytanoyl-CoA dioxygenase family protein [Kitasatospora viridis]TWF98940.1 ectoine hydroxylase-related dioxygenase (phytanoyl-CoA dioxygenase family) [Kitasatospora viridis]